MNAMRERGFSHVLANNPRFQQEGFSGLIERKNP